MYIRSYAVMCLFAKLFYDSFYVLPLLLPVGILYYRQEKRQAAHRQMQTLGTQFRDMILSVSTSQKAGYSVENAFLEARHDMALLHGREAEICTTLNRIAKGLTNNIPLENLLAEFGSRSGHTDIISFADVFAVAKRSGGSMTQIMNDTISLIGGKMEAEKEISVMIAAKRLESRLMEAVPFFIIAYVSLTNEGFFEPLYHNIAGTVFMTVAMGVYVFAFCMIEKIIAIEV